jgi:choline dehydrogenase-like flavoprotein
MMAPLQRLEARWDGLRSWNRVQGRLNPSARRIFGAYQHVRGVGGATLHFAGEAHRLHPRAMAMRSRFGVAADWPFDYAELEPYYVAAERLLGVAGPDGDDARWRSAPYPQPPHRFSHATSRLADGFRRAGLALVANPLAILSRPYDERPSCNYCSNCHRGCPRADKGSVDVTFVRRAVATGRCVVRARSEVLRVETGADDRVGRVVYVGAEGAERAAEARAVVVAGGAVFTPRLLLASASPDAPEGLANESGQVGRNFMETLFWISSGLHPEPLGSHRGVPVDAINWDHNAPDSIEGVIGGARFFPSAATADYLGPVNYATRAIDGWGLDHKRRMREAFGRIVAVGAIGESLPDPGSFVDLDPEQHDGNGVPMARIHSRLAEMEVRRLAFMAERCRAVLKEAGVEELVDEYGTYDIFAASHVFGTCRMGTDRETSVVDRFGRSHRWRNLFITDASVFPSSGGGEAPSLTIEALAIRTARHLAALLGRGDI